MLVFVHFILKQVIHLYVKIQQRKLSWNATSKIRSFEKASHKPGGGQVKIESRRLDWNVGSKVVSTNNIKHRPGGGKVEVGLIEIKTFDWN